MLEPLRHLASHATRPHPPIGLDVGRDSVRMVQLQTAPALRPSVVAAARREVHVRHRHAEIAAQGGLDEATATAIADLLRSGGFRGRRLVAALPRAIVQFKTLRLPVTTPEELPRHLARESRLALGIDVTAGEHVVHFLPGDTLRRGADTHQEGLLVVAGKAQLEQYMARLHGCGAEVAALDLEPLSLYRSVHRFNRRRRDAQDVQVLVDIGSRSTQVVIGRAGRVGFHKQISIGRDALHATVARKLDLGLEEASALCRRLAQQVGEAHRRGELEAISRDSLHRAVYSASRATLEDLARELSLCLRYYCVTFKCKRPDRVLLCGSLAEDPRLCETLSAALPVPVEPRRAVLDLEGSAPALAMMNQHPEEWTTAIGLALRFSPGGLAGRAGLTREAQAISDDAAELESDFGRGSEDVPAGLEPMPGVGLKEAAHG